MLIKYLTKFKIGLFKPTKYPPIKEQKTNEKREQNLYKVLNHQNESIR